MEAIINQVFEICDRPWRGIGVIPQSGYKLRIEFAKLRFPEIQTKHVEMISTDLIAQESV